MQHKIKVVHKVGEEFLSDILVTALDANYGGSNSWAVLEDLVTAHNSACEWRGKDPAPRTADCSCSTIWVSVAVWERDEDDDVEGRQPVLTVVDHDKMAKTIQTILKARCFNDDVMQQIERGVAEQDAGNIDAIGADCIMQMAVLGSYTYG